MPTIARLAIAPVKSAALQHPAQIDIQAGGIVGDRRFVLIDQDGRRVSATKLAALVPVWASFDSLADRLTLRFPDGSVIDGSTATDGKPVVASFWDVESPATTVDPIFDAELSRHLSMPVRLVQIARLTPGPRAVTVIAAATITDLAERMDLGPAALDVDRFRMSIVLADAPRWVEDEWEGRQIRIGDEAVVEVNRSVTRCVVTCWDPTTGVQDIDTLGPLATYRKLPDGKLALGRYARVLKPGIARLGDTVAPL